MLYDVISNISGFFYNLSPLLVSLIKVAFLLLSLEIGYRGGLFVLLARKDTNKVESGIILNSTLALLGLIFAFTFSASIHRHDLRKQGLIEEANAIGTAFLRADLVEDPGKSEIQETLLGYARMRIVPKGVEPTLQQQSELIRASNEAISDLWSITISAITKQDLPAAVEMALVGAINDVIDQGTIRNAAIRDRLPGAVLWMLMLISAFALAEAGYKQGLKGEISRMRYSAFVLVLAIVMNAIMDYDRPRDGVIRISQAAMIDTVIDMENRLSGN